MTLSALESLGNGLSWGLSLHKTEQTRNSIAQGVNYSLETVMELSEIALILKQVGRLFEVLKKPNLPYFRSFLLLSAVPISLSVSLAENFWTNRTVKKAALLMHNHFGRICQVTGAIASVALIYYGQTMFGSVSLIGSASLPLLALQKLGVDKNGHWLPKIRHVLDAASFYLMIPLGLFFSTGIIEKVIAGADLFFLIGEQVFKKTKNEGEEDRKLLEIRYPNAPREAVTFQTLLDLKNRTKEVEVNPGYIYSLRLPLEKGKDVQLSQLIDISFGIIPKIEPVVLEKKLSQDNRFQQIYGGETYTYDLGLEYIKKQIKIFLDKLENKGIIEGEPKNYDELIEMLKFIIFSMQTQDEVTQKDTILRLAIEGGDYCGPGMYDVLEDEMLQYQEITVPDDCTDHDLVHHLLLIFRGVRLRAFQGVYYSNIDKLNVRKKFYANYSFSFSDIQAQNGIVEKIKYVAKTIWHMLCFLYFKCVESVLGNTLDRHTYNEASKYLGKTFNVASGGSENDILYQSGPFQDLLVSRLFYSQKKQIENLLLQGASGVQTHLEALLAKTTFGFSKPSFYNFWLSWVEKQSLTPDQKELFKEGLQEGKVIYQFQKDGQEELSFHIDGQDDAVDSHSLREERYLLLKAMLLELGIFKVC